MNQSPLKKAKDKVINKVLERFESYNEADLDKLLIELILKERKQLLQKLLGIEDENFVGNSSRNNNRSGVHNHIQQRINEVFENEILPELLEMLKKEKENVLKQIKAEFIESGYLLYKARTAIFEQSEEWIKEAAESIAQDLQENILKDSYEEHTNAGSKSKAL